MTRTVNPVKVEQIENGYLVHEVRWPIAGMPLTSGTVHCPSLPEVLKVLQKHFQIE
jgi:hypothetical protein